MQFFAEQMKEFRQGDARKLPLRKEEWGTFDVVHTRFMLEHVPDPMDVVEEAFLRQSSHQYHFQMQSLPLSGAAVPRAEESGKQPCRLESLIPSQEMERDICSLYN